jgi:hypothetical protein
VQVSELYKIPLFICLLIPPWYQIWTFHLEQTLTVSLKPNLYCMDYLTRSTVYYTDRDFGEKEMAAYAEREGRVEDLLKQLTALGQQVRTVCTVCTVCTV